jgi:3-methylfumaryl-CoA hydratase
MKEGYPALVVSGGLSALVLLDFARSQMDRPIESVSTRNVGLLHIGDEVVLKGRQSEDQWLMWAETTAGRRAVEMTIR